MNADKHILVVDDDQLLRETLGEMIDEMGYPVVLQPDGPSWDYMQQPNTCSLMLSDVDMPDITGFELLARMRRADIATPVALMSARADDSLRNASEEAGAITLLGKPVAPDAISTLIHHHFQT